MQNKKYQVCVVTYNLLSPAYVKPSYFPNIEKKYLDDEQRLEKTIKILKKWMENKAVICLQELCEQWRERFEKLFKQNNYNFHSVIYSNRKSGVGISYPIELFDTVMVKSDSCFDKKKFDEIKEHSNNSQLLEELVNASSSENKFINVVAKIKKTGQNILLSTYHMPCRPLQKYFLVSHIQGLKTLLFDISQTHKCEHVILAGDFNIKTKDPEYNFLVGLSFPNDNNFESENIKDKTSDPEFIKELRYVYNKAGQKLDPMLELQSSHLKLHKVEPVYTNVSTMNDGGLFIECLDYCLITKSVEVSKCIVEFSIDNPNTSSYPNDQCPSDHQPLITTLLL